MRAIGLWMSTLVLVVAPALPPPGAKAATAAGADGEKLIGAWHLVTLGETGPDGKFAAVPGLKGMLVYTLDGHVSVQIMYPDAASNLTNDYVRNGYEASFGRYEVNEVAHTLTHHVEASITPALVGRQLTRAYRLSGNRLVISSTRADEHWSVTWEHD